MMLVSRQPKPKKKKMQFSKKMCLMSWYLMAFTVCADLTLSYLGRTPIPSTTQALIAFVTVFFQGGYITQNIFRDTSLNNKGIHLTDDDKHYIEKEGTNGSGGV